MKTDVYEEKPRTQSDYKSGSSNQEFDQAEIMKKVEAAGTPGPAHKALQALVGDWKAEVKCWMDPAGAPEVIATYRAHGFSLARHDRLTGWSTLTLERR